MKFHYAFSVLQRIKLNYLENIHKSPLQITLNINQLFLIPIHTPSKILELFDWSCWQTDRQNKLWWLMMMMMTHNLFIYMRRCWFCFATQLIDDYSSDATAKRLVDTYDWYFLPVVNPDGYSHTWSSVCGLQLLSYYLSATSLFQSISSSASSVTDALLWHSPGNYREKISGGNHAECSNVLTANIWKLTV